MFHDSSLPMHAPLPFSKVSSFSWTRRWMLVHTSPHLPSLAVCLSQARGAFSSSTKYSSNRAPFKKRPSLPQPGPKFTLGLWMLCHIPSTPSILVLRIDAHCLVLTPSSHNRPFWPTPCSVCFCRAPARCGGPTRRRHRVSARGVARLAQRSLEKDSLPFGLALPIPFLL